MVLLAIAEKGLRGCSPFYLQVQNDLKASVDLPGFRTHG